MEDANRFMEPSRIDYHKLSSALDHYEARGYEYMEVPWVVSREAEAATLPPDATATSVQYGELVGSAEQGFIELLLRGRTVLKACAITPCFRMEDSYDELHHAYFMKLELINTDASRDNLWRMIHDAQDFLGNYTRTEIEQTGTETYDLVDSKHHIELGSYGIRTFRNTPYIYGTGVALPRLDTVIRKK